MPVYDICKAVTTDRIIALKVTAVHIPELAAAQTELTGVKESLTTAEQTIAERDQQITDLNAQLTELQNNPGAEPQAGAAPQKTS